MVVPLLSRYRRSVTVTEQSRCACRLLRRSVFLTEFRTDECREVPWVSNGGMQQYVKFAASLAVLFVAGYLSYRTIDHKIKTDPDFLKTLGPSALACACFLSGFPVPTLFTASTLVAGFVLGLAEGVLIAVPSVLLGMMVCFEGARHWFKDAAQASVSKYAPDLSATASRHPRIGIVLVRLLPVPFSFQNLFWASCTDATRTDFFVFSSVVIVPHAAFFVYLGSSSKNLAEALSRKPSAAFPVARSLCAAIVLIAVITRYVRRQLNPEPGSPSREV